jgi:hypothetical protein
MVGIRHKVRRLVISHLRRRRRKSKDDSPRLSGTPSGQLSASTSTWAHMGNRPIMNKVTISEKASLALSTMAATVEGKGRT